MVPLLYGDTYHCKKVTHWLLGFPSNFVLFRFPILVSHLSNLNKEQRSVLNETNYHDKMMDHLTTSDNYIIINKDSRNNIMCEVAKAIKCLSLDKLIKKRITPCNAIMPRIYAFPIQKEGVPLRSIVNTIGSPTYHTTKFLSKTILFVSR